MHCTIGSCAGGVTPASHRRALSSLPPVAASASSKHFKLPPYQTHIKLKSNSNQSLRATPQHSVAVLPPAETRKSPPAAAGGGSLLRAQPLQPPTPEKHAACVCESSMRQRTFLLAPFSPHTPSTPWQALPSMLSSNLVPPETLSETQRQKNDKAHETNDKNNDKANDKLKTSAGAKLSGCAPQRLRGWGGGWWRTQLGRPERPRAPPPLWGPEGGHSRWSPRCRPDAAGLAQVALGREEP